MCAPVYAYASPNCSRETRYILKYGPTMQIVTQTTPQNYVQYKAKAKRSRHKKKGKINGHKDNESRKKKINKCVHVSEYAN